MPGGTYVVALADSGDIIAVNAHMCDGTNQTGWACVSAFSSDSTAIATDQPACQSHGTGVSEGSTTFRTVAADVPGPYCGDQTLHSQRPVNITRRPHHLKVGNDLLGSTNSCSGVKRIIDWIVHDQNHNIVASLSIIEVPTGSTTDSCANQTVVYTSSCNSSAVNSGLFEDTITSGCPGTGSCGFDWVPNKWKWCGATQVTLATLDYNVHHDQIKINGTASSLQDTEIMP